MLGWWSADVTLLVSAWWQVWVQLCCTVSFLSSRSTLVSLLHRQGRGAGEEASGGGKNNKKTFKKFLLSTLHFLWLTGSVLCLRAFHQENKEWCESSSQNASVQCVRLISQTLTLMSCPVDSRTWLILPQLQSHCNRHFKQFNALLRTSDTF